MLSSIIAYIMILTCASSWTLRTSFARNRYTSRLLSSVTDREALNVKCAEDVEYKNFGFELIKQDDKTRSRLGKVTTPHGVIYTPNFVFCATKAAMKAITPAQLWEAGSQIILSNTYHLMLTPGPEIVEQMGGLQKFTGWRGPMLTDSGGYQIFSMGFGSVSSEIKGKRDTVAMGWNQTLIKIDESGATFRSYVDGTIHYLTPERSIDIQRQLGADLIVVLDECTPFNVDKDYTAESMRRSHRWAIRSLTEFNRTDDGKQALYGIIQGGIYEDLRDESTAFINSHAFFGTAIGGSLGASKKDMHDIVAYTRARVRDDRPVHLLGIGGVRDIFHGVRQGIDTFDCVHPSRLGRHGGALVMTAHWDEEPNEVKSITPMTMALEIKKEKMRKKNLERMKTKAWQEGLKVPEDIIEENISSIEDFRDSTLSSSSSDVESNNVQQSNSGNSEKQRKNLRMVREHINVCKSRMRNDPRPIDITCECYTCKNFSRAYLHHLFKAKETLGGTLVTIHNVFFMNRLMGQIREGIANDNLDEVEAAFVHKDLVASLIGDNDIEVSDGIGS
jgi:queuine tRNA-ribosyltransferase